MMLNYLGIIKMNNNMKKHFTERELQLIYDSLTDTMFKAINNNGYFQCNYSEEEIRNLCEKVQTLKDNE